MVAWLGKGGKGTGKGENTLAREQQPGCGYQVRTCYHAIINKDTDHYNPNLYSDLNLLKRIFKEKVSDPITSREKITNQYSHQVFIKQKGLVDLAFVEL